MVWLPDHIWLAQKKGKSKGKSGGGTDANDLLALLLLQAAGDGGGAKGGWQKKPWTAGKEKGLGKGRFAQKVGQKKQEPKKPKNVDSIQLLQGCIGKKLKRPVAKDEIVYDFSEGGDDGNKVFLATVTSGEFTKSSTYTGKFLSSKVDAKKDAAKEALKDEFPAVFASMKHAPKMAVSKQAKAAMNGDPKSKLYSAVALVLGRPVTKTDLLWDVTQNGNPPKCSFFAKLQIPELNSDTFQGTASTSKKDAESSAAQKALKRLGPVVERKRKENESMGKKRKLTGEEKVKFKAQSEKLRAIDPSKKVWVGGLGEEVTDAQLKACFAKAGKVALAERLRSGAAVVVYGSKIEADKAVITLNGTALGKSFLTIDNWTKSEKKAKT